MPAPRDMDCEGLKPSGRGGGLRASTSTAVGSVVTQRGRADRRLRAVLLGVALGGLGVMLVVVCRVLAAVASHTRQSGSAVTRQSVADEVLLLVIGTSTLFVAGAVCKLALDATRQLGQIMAVGQNTPASLLLIKTEGGFLARTFTHTHVTESRLRSRKCSNIPDGTVERCPLRGKSDTRSLVPVATSSGNMRNSGWKSKAASMTRDDRRTEEVVVHSAKPCTCVPCVSASDYVVGWQREVGFQDCSKNVVHQQKPSAPRFVTALYVEQKRLHYASTSEDVRSDETVMQHANLVANYGTAEKDKQARGIL